MMWYDSSPRLRDRIIALFSNGMTYTAQELTTQFKQAPYSFSASAIYKELSLLVESGAVLRINRRYRLSVPWLYDMIAYWENALASMEKNLSLHDLLPEPHTRHIIRVKEHKQADRLWSQIISAIIATGGEPVTYQALEHRWWPLLHRDLGRQYRQVMKAKQITSFCVIAGNTYLDREFVRLFPQKPSRCVVSPRFSKDMPPFLTVCGDYIIRSRYPDVFRQELDQYFRSIKSVREIAYADIQHLFRSTGIITCIVEHNPRKAARLIRKFREMFSASGD
jgi:hypothetical protein